MEKQNDNILDKYYKSIKDEDYSESFDDLESWLRREAVISTVKPEKSKFTFLKYVFSEGRLKFAYLFLILIFLGVTGNFSVTRTETVGTVMSWTVDKEKPEVIKKIDNLDWIDKSQLVVEESNADGKKVLNYKVLIPTNNSEEIEKLKIELANINDVQFIKSIPISEPVKQPLYAVALEKVFQYDFNKNTISPDELRNNIYEQLRYAGIQNYVDLNTPSNGGAGKFVNINFGREPDSVRIKAHFDIVNEYDIDQAMEEVDNILAPMQVLDDDFIKSVIVRINGDNIDPNVIMTEVHRNLDTLHLKLRNNDIHRKEKMDKFKEKMEKFNESMEKFNKRMEKFNERMEKYNEKMEKYNEKMENYGESMEKLKKLPKIEFNYDFEPPEPPEPPEVDIDVEVETPEPPELNDYNFNFNFEDLEKNLKIMSDTLKVHFDLEKMERINKKIEEKMKKADEKLKKMNEKLKNKNYNSDSLKIKIEIDDDDDEDIDVDVDD